MDRRAFLSRTAALSTAGLAGALDLFPLTAQAATTDYKALVCVFLFGGVDGNNVIVPIDTAGYGAYAAVRGASSGIQLTQSGTAADLRARVEYVLLLRSASVAGRGQDTVR